MSGWGALMSGEGFEDIDPLLGPHDVTSSPQDTGLPPEESDSGTPNPRPCVDAVTGSQALEDKVTIRRTLGISEAVGIGIGIIVGSGIFISPADVAQNTGSVGEALLVWAFCGIISTIGALCFAELGILIPKSGGDYIYLYEIFGPFWAFLRLWIEVIVIRPSSHAIIALTFAYYTLQPFFDNGGRPPSLAVQLLGSACIAILSWLNCASIKWATRIQSLFTVAKVAGLILIVVLGVLEICKGRIENFQTDTIFKGSVTDPGNISMALYAGLWAFSGWNELNFVVDEIKNPSRNLPISITLSIVSTTVLFIAVNVSYFTLLTPEDMESQEATAVLFGRLVLGKYSYIISICVALCCFGGINGSLFTSSRFFYAGACNGHLPTILAMINVKSTAPTPTIILTGILSILYMVTDDVFALINYCNFVYFFAMGFAILGLIVIRIRDPTPQEITLKLPLVFPILAVFVCLTTGVLSFLRAPEESGIGVGMVLSAVPVYFIFVHLRKPESVSRVLDHITTALQCLTQSVAEEK